MGQISIGDFVGKVMDEKNLSGKDVQRAASDKVHQTTVNRIKNGEITDPAVSTLQALAKGLGVGEHELFVVARGLSIGETNLTHERLAAIDVSYESLSNKKREHADYIIEVLEREIVRLASLPDQNF
jgi:transcriptional regulator with XRE-family HTH domain